MLQQEEKTQTIYGGRNILSACFDYFAEAKESYDTCGDLTLPGLIITNESIRNVFLQFRKKEIKTRFITKITEKNITYCKELMKIVYELRHLEGMKLNFGVSESDYVAIALQQQQQAGRPNSQLVHSNAGVMIEQQRFFFETLWNKAIPAEQRIKEIERGIRPEVIETIREPSATQERVFELLKSANEEILVIFSTSNAFRRQEKVGAFDLLRKIAKSKEVKVKILSPFDDYVSNLIDKIKREDKIRIEIRNIEEPLQINVSILIVDRTSLLSAELKSDWKETPLEAMGLATYSNSKPTVLSYISIFESLWNQTYMYEETRAALSGSSNHTIG